MRRALAGGALLALASCKRGPAPTPAPSAVASVPSSAARAAAVSGETPPKYRVFHVFPKGTSVFGLGTKLIACEQSCLLEVEGSRRPRAWLVHPEQVEEDASLLPPVRPSEVTRVRYVGRYPDEVHAIAMWGSEEETKYDAYRYLGRGEGNRFAAASLPEDYWATPQPKCREHCEPFARYEQEKKARDRTAPPTTDILFGEGGPMLVLEFKQLWSWNGQAWLGSQAPWCTYEAVRLATGASLVSTTRSTGCEQEPEHVSHAFFWISKSSTVHALDLPATVRWQPLDDSRVNRIVELNGEAWIVAESESGSTVVLAPENGAEVSYHTP